MARRRKYWGIHHQTIQMAAAYKKEGTADEGKMVGKPIVYESITELTDWMRQFKHSVVIECFELVGPTHAEGATIKITSSYDVDEQEWEFFN